ncbi:MAG TPA: flagellar biosynthetic protein FliO [Bryobacteraceae bacterium]|nr:flagellar biosynthetic protein FliO [Bryobacteraceae bacterium]
MQDWTQLAAVLFVLGSLAALLWWLRAKGGASSVLAKMPGASGNRPRELRVLERVSITAQHSLILIEISGERMLVSFSPGHSNVTKLGGQSL